MLSYTSMAARTQTSASLRMFTSPLSSLNFTSYSRSIAMSKNTHNTLVASCVGTSIRSKSTSTTVSTKNSSSSPILFSSNQTKVGRQGDEYILSPAQIHDYHEKGYIHLIGLLSEEELKPLEDIYDRFMRREIPVKGKDLCDMSGDYTRKFEDFGIINAMLPRLYYPSLANNTYERRVKSVTRQLFGSDDFDIDYDQLLAKKPTKSDAVFAWHCDMAYWPMTPDTRTATFSLAIDPTTKSNGCLRFVDGSHKSQKIREHKPISDDATKSHTIACRVDERTIDNPNGELVTYCEVGRGDVTVHNEYVVHGSGGNYTKGWRRTYVIATRPKETIKIEREAGFTHSHNDHVNWESFNKWKKI